MPEREARTTMPEPAESAGAGHESAASPRADLHDAIGWFVFGLAVLVGSLRMDRLADQHINPLTVPGLLPGLLGIGMMIVGAILGLRSWRHGARRATAPVASPERRLRRTRVLLATALCCGYAVVLIGHGLPFWIASSIYVTGSILAFARVSTDPAKRRIGLRAVAKALLIGVVSSIVIWLVFERLFLVRLP
jgi:hypothetical protein